ncbi:MAG: Asp23/Gls24 family envelope stress response protein [Mobilitalea sp.]
MKGKMNTQYGEIMIDNDVLAKYAGASAIECTGVVGMASVNMKDGIVKLLKPDSLNHGVNVTLEENRITIDLHIIVSYGVSISAVADNLISNVKYNVEEFSGIEVKKINIYVEGVRVID